MSESPLQGTPSPEAPFGVDRMIQAIIEPDDVRVLVADASATAFESEYRHLAGRLSAQVTASLCAGAVLLSADLKHDERLAFQARLTGPLGGFLYEVDQDLNFRGSTHKKVLPDHDTRGTPISEALGKGSLQVLRSTSQGIVYQGITTMNAGNIAADLEQHLMDSQQTLSRVRLDHGYSHQLTHAMGILIQALPTASEAGFEKIANLVCDRADALRPWPRNPAALLADVTRGLSCHTVGDRTIQFRCRCTRDRVIAMLKSVGPPEDGSGWPEVSRVVCAFCADIFEVTPDELTRGD